MENLYNDLQPAIQKFSEIFCVSTEYIQEHFMEYVLEYGKYCFARNIIQIGIWTLIFSLGMLLGIHFYETEIGDVKKSIKIIAFLIPIILFLGCEIIPYFANPTIYSIEKIMELIA